MRVGDRRYALSPLDRLSWAISDIQNASVKVFGKGRARFYGEFFAGFDKGAVFVRVMLLVVMIDRVGMWSDTFALTLTSLWV